MTERPEEVLLAAIDAAFASREGGQSTKRLSLQADLRVENVLVPKNAEVFFPFPERGGKKIRSNRRAIVYIGDQRGSTITRKNDSIKVRTTN